MTKKSLTLLLSMLMVLSFVLAACSGGGMAATKLERITAGGNQQSRVNNQGSDTLTGAAGRIHHHVAA